MASSAEASHCGSTQCCLHNNMLPPPCPSGHATTWVHFVAGGVGTGKTSWIACAVRSLQQSPSTSSSNVFVVVEAYADQQQQRTADRRASQLLGNVLHGWATKDPQSGSVLIPTTPTEANATDAQNTQSAAPLQQYCPSSQLVADAVVTLLTPSAPPPQAATMHIFVECVGESLDSVQQVLSRVETLPSSSAYGLRFSATVCYPCDVCDDTICSDADILAAFPVCWPRTAVGLCASCGSGPPPRRRPPPCPSHTDTSGVGSILFVTRPPGAPTAMAAAAAMKEQTHQWVQHVQHYEAHHSHRAVHDQQPNATTTITTTSCGVISSSLDELRATAATLRQRVSLPTYYVHELHTTHPVSVFQLIRFISDQLLTSAAEAPAFKLLRVKGFARAPNCNSKRFLLDLSAAHKLKPQSVRVRFTTEGSTAVRGCNVAPPDIDVMAASAIVFVFAIEGVDVRNLEHRRSLLRHWLNDAFEAGGYLAPRAPLRFPVGHFVDAHAANGWQRAVVVAQWDEGHAYRLRLVADDRHNHLSQQQSISSSGGGGDIWSPLDDDEYVVDAPQEQLPAAAALPLPPRLDVMAQSPTQEDIAPRTVHTLVFPSRVGPLSPDTYVLPPQHEEGKEGSSAPLSIAQESMGWVNLYRSRPAGGHRYAAQRLEVLLNLAMLRDGDLAAKLHRAVATNMAKRGGARRKPAALATTTTSNSSDMKGRWAWLVACVWEIALQEFKLRMERTDHQHGTQHTIQLYAVVLKLQAHVTCLTNNNNGGSSGCSKHPTTPYDPFTCFQWSLLSSSNTDASLRSECDGCGPRGNHSPAVIAIRALCAVFHVPLLPILLSNGVNPSHPIAASTFKEHVAPVLADALFLAGLEALLAGIPNPLVTQLLPTTALSTTATQSTDARSTFIESIRSPSDGHRWNFDCAFSVPNFTGLVIPTSTRSNAVASGVFSFHVHNIAHVLLDPTRLFYGPRFAFHGLRWYLLLSSENEIDKEDADDAKRGKAPPDIGVYLCVEEGGVACSFRIDLVNECRDDSVTVEAQHVFPKTFCGKGWGRGLCTARQTLCPSLGFATTGNPSDSTTMTPRFCENWPSPVAAPPHLSSVASSTCKWASLHTVTIEVQISVYPHESVLLNAPPPPAPMAVCITPSERVAPAAAAPLTKHHRTSCCDDGSCSRHLQFARELVEEEEVAARWKAVTAKLLTTAKTEEQHRRTIQHARRSALQQLWAEYAHSQADMHQRRLQLQQQQNTEDEARLLQQLEGTPSRSLQTPPRRRDMQVDGQTSPGMCTYELVEGDSSSCCNKDTDDTDDDTANDNIRAVQPVRAVELSGGSSQADEKAFRHDVLQRLNTLHRDCVSLQQSTLMVSAEVNELAAERKVLQTRLQRSDDRITEARTAVATQAALIAALKKRIDALQQQDGNGTPTRRTVQLSDDDGMPSMSSDDDVNSSRSSSSDQHVKAKRVGPQHAPRFSTSVSTLGEVKRDQHPHPFTTQVVGNSIDWGGVSGDGDGDAAQPFTHFNDWFRGYNSTSQ